MRLVQRIPPEAPIDSFYHHPESNQEMICQGTACFVARGLNPRLWEQACFQEKRVYCLGRCYAAPSRSSDESLPIVEVHSRCAVVMERIGPSYEALWMARSRTPGRIVEDIEASELRGRGGAGFPTGRKWRAVHRQPSHIKYVVANADEGDPGAFIDRIIMEDDPHRLLAGMAIAAYAVGASKGIIYLRAEYTRAHDILQKAINEARVDFEFQIVRGHGSYVCGEETAMLNSIEGKRPEVRTRPPYPTESGLFGRPTLVNNVETFATVPWIIQHGPETYRALGFSKSRGTKLVSLNSLFGRPGLYEIEFGIPVRRVCEEIGGGLKNGSLRGVIVGGPLAGIIPPSLLDTPFGFEELQGIGAAVGHGGIVAFDESTSIRELVEHVLSFAAYESCGKCTPCRIGNAALVRSLQDRSLKRSQWDEIISAMARTSLCGLGTGVAEFAQSVSRYYGKELASCFT